MTKAVHKELQKFDFPNLNSDVCSHLSFLLWSSLLAPKHNPDKLWSIKWKKFHLGLFTDVILSEHSLFNLNKKQTKMFCDSHTVIHLFWKCIRTLKLRQYVCRLIADNIICSFQLCFWQMCFFAFFKTVIPAKNEYFPVNLIILLVDFQNHECKFAKVKPHFLVFNKETEPHKSSGGKRAGLDYSSLCSTPGIFYFIFQEQQQPLQAAPWTHVLKYEPKVPTDAPHPSPSAAEGHVSPV